VSFGVKTVTKPLIILMLCMLALPTFAQEYDRSSMPSEEAVLEAIQLLRESPTGVEAKEAADQIMVFGHLSDDVFVSLKARYTPWMRGHLPEVIEDKLIAAFVGGNMEYQLNTGITEDRPYEGTVMMLSVYEELRAADAAPKIRRFELYRQWLAEGSLQSRLN
jgi:hypothetical protein